MTDKKRLERLEQAMRGLIKVSRGGTPLFSARRAMQSLVTINEAERTITAEADKPDVPKRLGGTIEETSEEKVAQIRLKRAQELIAKAIVNTWPYMETKLLMDATKFLSDTGTDGLLKNEFKAFQENTKNK